MRVSPTLEIHTLKRVDDFHEFTFRFAVNLRLPSCSYSWQDRPCERPSPKHCLNSVSLLMDVGSVQGFYLRWTQTEWSEHGHRQNGQNLLELVPRVLNRPPLLAWHGIGNAHVHELVEVLHHVCQLRVYGI